MSKYSDVRSTYFDEEEELQYVDAWITADDNEEGCVIAKINLANKSVEYLDPDAQYDNYAQEVIGEVLKKGYALTE